MRYLRHDTIRYLVLGLVLSAAALSAAWAANTHRHAPQTAADGELHASANTEGELAAVAEPFNLAPPRRSWSSSFLKWPPVACDSVRECGRVRWFSLHA